MVTFHEEQYMEWHFVCVRVEGLRESRAHQIVPFCFLVRPIISHLVYVNVMALLVSKGGVVRVLTPASMSASTVHISICLSFKLEYSIFCLSVSSFPLCSYLNLVLFFLLVCGNCSFTSLIPFYACNRYPIYVVNI